ncbi:MAG: oxidoreductase [Betaproteobacteria bacterium RIFCSPLOWO2_02_FULL_62_17]|nr:MAG: oxidoreductase [Betaproteobacteria bacterium RIFCSPLOWO2_02_FULL_62_17]
MKKWNLVFDLELCTGCQSCAMAVKDEYVGNEFPGYAATMPLHGAGWVQIHAHERGRFPAVDLAYIFQCCQHCDDAPCMKVARNGAVKKRSDGIVMIDPALAKGQKELVDACPFHAVHWNEELSLPQAWNFDAHLLDAGWSAPRPVQSCPTGALRALKVEDDEMRRIASEERLQRLEPGEKHRTRVHYKNLYRFTSVFVAGTLVGRDQGLEACVRGAEVRLMRGSTAVGSGASDAYGDFRFDGLPPESGAYRVEIAAKGYRGKNVELELTNSHWLGEIRLDAA